MLRQVEQLVSMDIEPMLSKEVDAKEGRKKERWFTIELQLYKQRYQGWKNCKRHHQSPQMSKIG